MAEDEKQCAAPEHLEIALRVAKEVLVMTVRDTVTKRLFTADFDCEDLTSSGFHPSQSLEDVQNLIDNAARGSTATDFRIGYTQEEVSAPKKQTQVTEGELPMAEEYQKGDRMVITIRHNVQFFKLVYVLSLDEVEQSETEILHEIIKDIRRDLLATKEELNVTRIELADAKRDLGTAQKRIAVLDDQKAQEAQREAQRQAQQPQVGCWQSTAIYNTNFRNWNVPMAVPPEGLFEFTEEGSKVVFKKTGLYRISGHVGLATGQDGYVQLQKNGAGVCTLHNCVPNTWGSGSFNLVAPFNAEETLTVFTTAPSEHQSHNTLVIELLT